MGCVTAHLQQQEHQGWGCYSTLTPARTPRRGLVHNTSTPARTPRRGLVHNTSTPARTPRRGLVHSTSTPARTPRLHTVGAATRCKLYGDGLRTAIICSLHPPRRNTYCINHPKTTCGCPCGGLIILFNLKQNQTTVSHAVLSPCGVYLSPYNGLNWVTRQIAEPRTTATVRHTKERIPCNSRHEAPSCKSLPKQSRRLKFFPH